MAAGFFLVADFVGIAIGIAIVGDRLFELERCLVAALPLSFFFPAVNEVAFELTAGFFFFVGLPIGIFMGIFDFEVSRPAGCGC